MGHVPAEGQISILGILQGSVIAFKNKSWGEGTYVYLWLIHVDVWQKPTQ